MARRFSRQPEGNVTGSRIDPTTSFLPSGRAIALLFYDGPIYQGIVFESLLKSGEFWPIVYSTLLMIAGTVINWRTSRLIATITSTC